jgi:hypothetical protein
MNGQLLTEDIGTVNAHDDHGLKDTDEENVELH